MPSNQLGSRLLLHIQHYNLQAIIYQLNFAIYITFIYIQYVDYSINKEGKLNYNAVQGAFLSETQLIIYLAVYGVYLNIGKNA